MMVTGCYPLSVDGKWWHIPFVLRTNILYLYGHRVFKPFKLTLLLQLTVGCWERISGRQFFCVWCSFKLCDQVSFSCIKQGFEPLKCKVLLVEKSAYLLLTRGVSVHVLNLEDVTLLYYDSHFHPFLSSRLLLGAWCLQINTLPAWIFGLLIYTL